MEEATKRRLEETATEILIEELQDRFEASLIALQTPRELENVQGSGLTLYFRGSPMQVNLLADTAKYMLLKDNLKIL